MMLASPATGPIKQVWFSEDGVTLYARTAADKIFQTSDFETWRLAVSPVPDPPAVGPATAIRLPEATAHLVRTLGDPNATYALGRHLQRSEDGGRSWANLTAIRAASVIGIGQNSVAVSPQDPKQIVVGNNYGVWRSMDGGLSWAGLNQFLPNLAIDRIIATAAGGIGTRIRLENGSIAELPPGGSVWLPLPATPPDADAKLRAEFSAALGIPVSSVASNGNTIYLGTLDGRLLGSIDGGRNFDRMVATGGVIERILVNPSEPRVALAAVGGQGASHILHTINSGQWWDSLDGNLPTSPAHGVTADWASGAVYAATDKGVFYAQADLENASPAPSWVSLTDNLPAVPARDVRLDPAGVQLYMALDGYGVYAAPAPHRLRNFRVVSAADYTARAAAPGSLLSVVGGHVESAANGGLNYPVLSASDAESQIQVPFDEQAGNVSLLIQTPNGAKTAALVVQAVSPAIVVGRDSVAMLADAETGMSLDAVNATHSGARVQIMATGLGKVKPNWPTGMAAPADNPPVVTATVRAFLNGAPIEVTRATLAPGYIGFYLIEARLPAITNVGASELYITADGHESNHVQIVIE